MVIKNDLGGAAYGIGLQVVLGDVEFLQPGALAICRTLCAGATLFHMPLLWVCWLSAVRPGVLSAGRLVYLARKFAGVAFIIVVQLNRRRISRNGTPR